MKTAAPATASRAELTLDEQFGTLSRNMAIQMIEVIDQVCRAAVAIREYADPVRRAQLDRALDETLDERLYLMEIRDSQ